MNLAKDLYLIPCISFFSLSTAILVCIWRRRRVKGAGAFAWHVTGLRVLRLKSFQAIEQYAYIFFAEWLELYQKYSDVDAVEVEVFLNLDEQGKI